MPDGPWHLFRADLTEVLMVALGDGRLQIDVWRPGEPVRRLLRGERGRRTYRGGSPA